MQQVILGNEEFVSIPEINIPIILARIDSGAASSVLHAFNIKIVNEEGKKFITFCVHPITNNRIVTIDCKSKLTGWKYIRSSNGMIEKRPFFITNIKVGEVVCENVEITLTNRDYMGHRMLIGRESLPQGTLVDLNKTFVATKNLESAYQKISKDSLKPLKIALLASNPNLYSNIRIMEAGKKLGHEMIFLNIKNCYIDIQQKSSTIHCRDVDQEKIAEIDAVIPRIKPSLTFYGCALVRQFQTIGKFCLNDANGIANSRDKLKSLQILASRCMPMPSTGFATSSKENKQLIDLVGGAPLVIKLLEGTQGKGVILVESNISAESVISAFKSADANILVQEFISESKGQDLRCFVVDYKVVGSMLRSANSEQEFRANFHLGGSVHPVKITSAEKKIAVTAAKLLGLPVAGVDIIRSKRGPMILEVNSSPGLEGIENASGKDIATEMIHCLERHFYGTKSKRKKQ
jgi:ribosomal protein S6--L-glutamate ligase